MSQIKITISETGPYKVEGLPALHDHQGHRMETREEEPFFLCRCGHSDTKPFCNGTHSRVAWNPELTGRE